MPRSFIPKDITREELLAVVWTLDNVYDEIMNGEISARAVYLARQEALEKAIKFNPSEP